jgi:hypothetical protein
MGDFSRTPIDVLTTNLQKGYVGLHVEQGVPILDRDLNLLNDLISATVRAVVSRYIGSGLVANMDASVFAIQAIPANNDFQISAGAAGAGALLVGGIEVTIKAPTPVKYSSQPGLPPLNTPGPTQPDPRTDVVFLDVWLVEVDGTLDTDLLNAADIGLQTSVRQKPIWAVRVAEGIPVPPPATGHTHYPLAQLVRPRGNNLIDATMITDLRKTILPLVEVEHRLLTLEQYVLLPAFDPPGSQFVPPFGAPGTKVTLFGHNFDGPNLRVSFGGVLATTMGTVTSTQIKDVVVPTMPAGQVPITVTTDFGSKASDDKFEVKSVIVGNPPAFDPPGGQFLPPFGAPGTKVTLFGKNFDGPNLKVSFGGVQASTFGSVTPTQIKDVVVPAMPAGQAPITVTTDFGSKASDDKFQVN